MIVVSMERRTRTFTVRNIFRSDSEVHETLYDLWKKKRDKNRLGSPKIDWRRPFFLKLLMIIDHTIIVGVKKWGGG